MQTGYRKMRQNAHFKGPVLQQALAVATKLWAKPWALPLRIQVGLPHVSPIPIKERAAYMLELLLHASISGAFGEPAVRHQSCKIL